MSDLDLVGIAAIITSLTGATSLIISVYLVIRVLKVQKTTDHIQDLTNSNFSKMQSLLSEAIETTEKAAVRDRQRSDKNETLSGEKET